MVTFKDIHHGPLDKSFPMDFGRIGEALHVKATGRTHGVKKFMWIGSERHGRSCVHDNGGLSTLAFDAHTVGFWLSNVGMQGTWKSCGILFED